MADRLGESNNVLIQSLKENAKNKNTQQSTNNWLKVWKSWASQKGYGESIEKYEPEALKKILEDFYATVRKKDGEDYEPDSLRVMVTAIDRYLTEKEYKHTIIRDREFKSSKLQSWPKIRGTGHKIALSVNSFILHILNQSPKFLLSCLCNFNKAPLPPNNVESNWNHLDCR